MTPLKFTYEETHGAVLRALRHFKPTNRHEEKTVLFSFHYDLSWDSKGIVDAVSDYHRERVSEPG